MAVTILEAIWQNGGEADTSEIKEYTGFEDNSRLHYRRTEHLEPNGFVECTTEDRGGTLTVTVWQLTEQGEKAVDRHMTDTDTPPLKQTVDELREIVGDLNRKVQSFEGRVNHVEETNVTDDDLEELQDENAETESGLEQRLNRIEAKQDALLGLFYLYELVNTDRVQEIGEEHADSYQYTEGVNSQAFKAGAAGQTAGNFLKVLDGDMPDGLLMSDEEIAETVAEKASEAQGE